MNGMTLKFPRILARTFFILLFFLAILRVEPACGQPQRTGGRTPGGNAPTRQDPDAIYTGPPETPAPLKAEATLVPVRVVVRDSQGHAVTNLHKEDFKLFQDNKQQQIANFSVEFAPTTAQLSAALNPADITKPHALNLAPPLRFVALFFDDAHLSIQDLTRARNAAGHYLDSSMQSTDRVAVLTVSGQTQLDFTDDSAKLHATLLKLLPHAVSAGEAASFDCPPMDFYEADAIQNQNDSQAFGIATQDALNCAFDGLAGFPQRSAEHGYPHRSA